MGDYTIIPNTDGTVTITRPGWKGVWIERSDAPPAAESYVDSVNRYSENGTWTVGPFPPGKHIIRVRNAAGGVPYFGDFVTVPEVATVATPTILGGISDGSIASQIAPVMDECGVTDLRIYVTWNTTTGAINNPDTLQRANQLRAMGKTVRIVLNPDGGKHDGVFPQLLINSVKTILDPGVEVNGGNEVDQKGFWTGTIDQAFELYSRIADALPGFSVGSPSFATNNHQWQAETYRAQKAAGRFRFKRLVTHNYPNQTEPYSFVQAFGDFLATLSGVAKEFGVRLDIDEYGYDAPLRPHIRTIHPQVIGLFNKHGVGVASYFILTNTYKDGKPRLPHTNYAWRRDMQTGETKQDVLDMFKAGLLVNAPSKKN